MHNTAGPFFWVQIDEWVQRAEFVRRIYHRRDRRVYSLLWKACHAAPRPSIVLPSLLTGGKFPE